MSVTLRTQSAGALLIAVVLSVGGTIPALAPERADDLTSDADPFAPVFPQQDAAGWREDHLGALGSKILDDPAAAEHLARGVGDELLARPLSLGNALSAAVKADGIHVPPPADQGPAPTLAEGIEQAWQQAGRPLDPSERSALQQETARLEPEVERALAVLVHAMNHATQLRGDPFSGLTDEDLYRLALHQDRSGPYTLTEGEATALVGSESDGPTHLREIEDVLSRVDRVAILQSQAVLAAAVDRSVALLSSGVPAAGVTTSSGDVFEAPTPYGPVRVSGTEAHEHTEDSFLHIDLGGDDTYLNRAGAVGADILGLGGITPPPDPGSPGFLPWAEDTRQRIHDSHNASIEIDLDGDDTYSSDHRGAQGYGGFGGFGALIDLGGDDLFTGNTFAQGAGEVAGAGFLVSVQGQDRFHINHQGQGFGQDGGGGFLLAGTGSNTYDASTRAQGVGWAANLAGVLVDTTGDDTYHCSGVLDFSDSILPVDLERPGSICQSAGWGGTAILVDGQGSDRYSTVSSFAHGMSLIGTGVLVDLDGVDVYDGGEWSQAMGVLGAGVLYDGSGDDTYRSDQVEGPWVDTYIGSSGMGYLGAGVLVDLEGSDRYTSIARKGLHLYQYACGQACSYVAGTGILIDGGGDDRFRSEVGQGGAFIGHSLLISTGGDDTFVMDHNSRRAQGYAEKVPPLEGLEVGDCDYGFLVDLDGSNSYSNPTTDFGTRSVDSHWGQGDYGRGMDGTTGTVGYLSGEFLEDAQGLLQDTACTYAVEVLLLVLCESTEICLGDN